MTVSTPTAAMIRCVCCRRFLHYSEGNWVRVRGTLRWLCHTCVLMIAPKHLSVNALQLRVRLRLERGLRAENAPQDTPGQESDAEAPTASPAAVRTP